MNVEKNLFDLARQVETLETAAVEVSKQWYEFAAGKKTDFEELDRLSSESLDVLTQLSNSLAETIHNLGARDSQRDSLQYAYNLVQELIQSRQANVEMLDSILSGKDFKEYLRALSIKEKAALQQATTLRHTLENTKTLH